MHTMEFSACFVPLVMSCVTSVLYSLLMNGTSRGQIIPSRGIRQGDPISIYLFLIVAEGFSSVLQWAEESWRRVSLLYCGGCTID